VQDFDVRDVVRDVREKSDEKSIDRWEKGE